MTWLLRPGVGLARRDADHLQLGTDPPLAAVLPDSRAVRLPARRAGPRQPAHHPRRVDRAGARRAGRRGSGRGGRRGRRATRPPRRLPGPASTRPTASSRRCCGWSARPASGSPAHPRRRRWRWSGARASRRARGSTTGCGPARRTWWSGKVPAARCSVPTSSRAPPPACAASTPISASTTRGGRWWSSRSPRRHRCGRPSPIRRCARWPWRGRCATSPPARRAGCRPRGRPRWRLGRAAADRHDVPPPPPLRLRLGRGPRRPGRRPRGPCPGGLSGHQYSLSSLPSIARRCSREQLSQ